MHLQDTHLYMWFEDTGNVIENEELQALELFLNCFQHEDWVAQSTKSIQTA